MSVSIKGHENSGERDKGKIAEEVAEHFKVDLNEAKALIGLCLARECLVEDTKAPWALLPWSPQAHKSSAALTDRVPDWIYKHLTNA